MTRSVIVRLFVGSLIGAGVGTALFVLAAAVGIGDEVLIMNGPDVVGIRPGALSTMMIVTAGLASLLWMAATVAVVVAWVGAIINTASLPSKTWLAIELVLGLLGLPFVAVLAYVVGRPEATAYDPGPGRTAQPAATDGRRPASMSGTG
ncbi:MAG TPA: hypothetical protein VE476_16310 [Propionibacteriaceae bacterium]|jgi:hypothetical protein|nr:hypothetical protein [Propionibacteriaceae bacterium]